jgi:hypothetical protein
LQPSQYPSVIGGLAGLGGRAVMGGPLSAATAQSRSALMTLCGKLGSKSRLAFRQTFLLNAKFDRIRDSDFGGGPP